MVRNAAVSQLQPTPTQTRGVGQGGAFNPRNQFLFTFWAARPARPRRGEDSTFSRDNPFLSISRPALRPPRPPPPGVPAVPPAVRSGPGRTGPGLPRSPYQPAFPYRQPLNTNETAGGGVWGDDAFPASKHFAAIGLAGHGLVAGCAPARAG